MLEPLHHSAEPSLEPIYGPVRSWRYGCSLGVDLLPQHSTCNFDCVYCQLGRIVDRSGVPRVFVPTARVLQIFEGTNLDGVDTITVSGNGEPTLATNLGEVLMGMRRRTELPVAVLTNASRLGDWAVRGALSFADIVECKLDAIGSNLLARVNRPASGITASAIVEGIRLMRRDLRFRGKLVVQVMVLPMTLPDMQSVAEVVAGIGVDEVHLNQPRRVVPRLGDHAMRGAHEASERTAGVALRMVEPTEAHAVRTIFEEMCRCPVLLAPS